MDLERVIIVGAGGAGQELLGELRKNIHNYPNYEFIGFVDDSEEKIGTIIMGLKVLGNIDDIPKILSEKQIKTVFIAIPSGEGSLINRIKNKCKEDKVKIKIVPRISEIINGVITLDQIRDVQVEDLLGRSMVRRDFSKIHEKTKDKVIMVCGAAGSIGSELCKQLIGLYPKQVICVDWWENGMFYLKQRLEKVKQTLERESKPEIKFIIGNIQNTKKIEAIVTRYKPDVIFNAAAYKHVPLMELNPSEAVKNNIWGTKNLIEISLKHKIKNFVLISTDKAVNPTSVMGATKRVTEKLMHFYSRQTNDTSFLAIRFGNVLNSNGSVIPTFKKQIQEGMVTVTHKDMVRYFMLIDEAVFLVLQCWVLGGKDEIFILDMGDPRKIIDLANLMIRLSGKEPEKDVKIKFIGLRPGEKIFEECLTKIEGTSATKKEGIFILKKDEFVGEDYLLKVEDIILYANSEDIKEELIKEKLKDLVSTYQYENKLK
jgi:FlaA1/EpsC-like NDP-sugar epimerase